MMPFCMIVGLFIFICLMTACENDLGDVKRISDMEDEEPLDISYGVTLVFSDSARVKAKLITEEMVHHTVADSAYYECPKDVLLIFYDKNQQEERRVTANYGIFWETKRLVELRHDVVATMSDGTVFKSEELFWDDNAQHFYNTVPMTITSKDGSTLAGDYFEADQNFDNHKIERARSLYYLKDGDEL